MSGAADFFDAKGDLTMAEKIRAAYDGGKDKILISIGLLHYYRLMDLLTDLNPTCLTLNDYRNLGYNLSRL